MIKVHQPFKDILYLFILYFLSCSIAIMTYMAEKYKTADHWYPADLKQRAKVNEYLSWQHAAMRLDAAKIIWLKVRDFNWT